jgi:hypothetical protein
MIVSKIKPGFIFWYAIMLSLTILLFVFLAKTFQRLEVNGIWTTVWVSAVFLLIISAALIVLRDLKYIKIDKQNREIMAFSLFAPFGKRLLLDKYIGFIKSSEVGSTGHYETIYLIDENRVTSFKINGLFYKNFDELCSGLGMKEIKKYKTSLGSYIKLLFTGKVQI